MGLSTPNPLPWAFLATHPVAPVQPTTAARPCMGPEPITGDKLIMRETILPFSLPGVSAAHHPGPVYPGMPSSALERGGASLV